jgi:hypothetical protein
MMPPEARVRFAAWSRPKLYFTLRQKRSLPVPQPGASTTSTPRTVGIREDGQIVYDIFLVQVKKPEDVKKPWDDSR